MKKLIFIPLLLISIAVNAATYYVATDGDDGGVGTIGDPWLTFDYSFDQVSAGDTVYYRGGIYHTLVTQYKSDLDGTVADPICFFNYPGETPIIDGVNRVSPSGGMTFNNSSNIKIRGITIRNILQLEAEYTNSNGFSITYGNNITLDRCVAHNIGYRAFYFYDVDTLYVYNCDAYNVVDSLSVTPGNAGDGFIQTAGSQDTTEYAVYRGCRAWHVSDDGWDVHTDGYIELDACWAILCGGYEDYNYGNGFKLNLSISLERDMISRRVTRCIAVYNRGSGFTTNDANQTAIPLNIYNNISSYNGIYGGAGQGFAILSTNSSEEIELKRVFRNNTSYANITNVVHYGLGYTHSNNTWDTEVIVTDADFIGSLDSTSVVDGLLANRQSDGSRPIFTNLNLADGSDLIDAGVDVGLPYNGSEPDIGYNESDPPLPPPAVGYKLTGGDGKLITGGDGKRLIGR